MVHPLPIIQGRGAVSNPQNRFERLAVADDLEQIDPGDEWLAQRDRPASHYFVDATRSILARNDSPDIGFQFSINPYRGCEHGCIYCYARPSHEWLGFSAGLDFETRILCKPEAPALLRKALSARGWQPQSIALSGNTDCYQPVEKKLRITRGCLEVLRDFRNPVSVITKNRLIRRDSDLLSEMAELQLVNVMISVTSLDARLSAKMEPRASAPAARLETIAALSSAGIPVGVMVAPIVPGLTDHEMPAILEAARQAGARAAGYVVLRLPYGLADIVEEWLKTHFPDRADKVLNRMRELRGGHIYDSAFGRRQRGQGQFADHLRQSFELYTRKFGYSAMPRTRTDRFCRPGDTLSLFGGMQ